MQYWMSVAPRASRRLLTKPTLPQVSLSPSLFFFLSLSTYIYIYIWMCACMCMGMLLIYLSASAAYPYIIFNSPNDHDLPDNPFNHCLRVGASYWVASGAGWAYLYLNVAQIAAAAKGSQDVLVVSVFPLSDTCTRICTHSLYLSLELLKLFTLFLNLE